MKRWRTGAKRPRKICGLAERPFSRTSPAGSRRRACFDYLLQRASGGGGSSPWRSRRRKRGLASARGRACQATPTDWAISHIIGLGLDHQDRSRDSECRSRRPSSVLQRERMMRRPTGCQSNACYLLALKICFAGHGQPSGQRRTRRSWSRGAASSGEVSPPATPRRRTLLLFHSGRYRLAIPAVDIAIFIFGTNPLVPSRPVVITIAVSRMFTPVPVAAISVVTIPVPISIISPTLVPVHGSRHLDHGRRVRCDLDHGRRVRCDLDRGRVRCSLAAL